MKSNSSLSCCALTGRNEGLRDREREIKRKEREREITSCCALKIDSHFNQIHRSHGREFQFNPLLQIKWRKIDGVLRNSRINLKFD